uniref:Zinc finger protein 655 n=1 Tax=Mus musculus TaxID=10090 RepID=A0ABJ3HNZ1_MOUSE
MEEVTSQEAAESPRGHFQPLENQSECLSPELRFLQDTDMEQGFSGGFPISKPDGISEREQDLQVFDLESKNREVIRGDCSACGCFHLHPHPWRTPHPLICEDPVKAPSGETPTRVPSRSAPKESRETVLM